MTYTLTASPAQDYAGGGIFNLMQSAQACGAPASGFCAMCHAAGRAPRRNAPSRALRDRWTRSIDLAMLQGVVQLATASDRLAQLGLSLDDGERDHDLHDRSAPRRNTRSPAGTCSSTKSTTCSGHPADDGARTKTIAERAAGCCRLAAERLSRTATVFPSQ